MITQIEQETYQVVAELFEILNEKFRLQYDETILSLQYCSLSRQTDETAEEWTGRLGTKAT